MASKSTSSGQTIKKPKELSTLAKIYLIIYNFGQVLGQVDKYYFTEI